MLDKTQYYRKKKSQKLYGNCLFFIRLLHGIVAKQSVLCWDCDCAWLLGEKPVKQEKSLDACSSAYSNMGHSLASSLFRGESRSSKNIENDDDDGDSVIEKRIVYQIKKALHVFKH